MSSQWHDPTADGRWPIPHHANWPDDIRVTTALAAQAQNVRDDLVGVFTNLDEVRWLADIFDEQRPQMLLRSSRKYTRIEIPNIRALRNAITGTLEDHGLAVSTNPSRTGDRYTYEIVTVRIGFPDETITYGELRGSADLPRNG
jgi:hypothetical protein